MMAEKIVDLDDLWKTVDQKTLVVFDIDDVIISTEDHFAHPYGYLKFVQLTDEALSRAKSEEEKDEIMHKASLSQLLGKRRLVEETFPAFIKNLQQAGVKVVALTNFPRGRYGAIPRTESWRIEHLKAFGIDFSLSFPEEESCEFGHISKAGLATPALPGFKEWLPPLFEKGILFANLHSKGEVLKSFFKKSQFYPNKVIFIDDLLHNHASVKEAMDSLDIPFTGIHYTGASQNFGTCNEELLRFQFHHLLSTSTWLSDKEILELWEKEDSQSDRKW